MEVKSNSVYFLKDKVKIAKQRVGNIPNKTIAQKLEKTEKHVSGVLSGKKGASYALACEIAYMLNTTVGYLTGETDNPELCSEEKKQVKMESNVHFEFEEPELKEKDLVSIPVLSPEQTACCGRGIPAAECTYRNEERVRVDRKDVGALCEGKMPFAIIADGDSMEKWGIKDGSRVVINPVEEVYDFDIALVCYKDRLALKKVQRRADGGISLLSSDGAVITVLPDEVNIPAVFSIWGKAMSYRYVYEEIGRIKHGL